MFLNCLIVLRCVGGKSLFKNVFSILIIFLLFGCFFVLVDTAQATTYTYTFNGPYDENYGVLIPGAVQVIAHYVNNYTSLICTLVDDPGHPSLTTFTYSTTSLPTYFEYVPFNMSSGYANYTAREYWLGSNEITGIFTVTVGENPTPIAFTIRALGGVDTGQLLRISRSFNATTVVIEQRLIDQTGNTVANLLPNTVYEVAFLNADGSNYYTFGNINAFTTPITLTLSPLSFPSDILLQYKYVHIYASRSTPSEIKVSYEDTRAQTLSVYYSISYINGTLAYNNTHLGDDSFTDIWLGANSSISYYLLATVIHAEFGTLTFNQVLTGSAGAASPIDFAIFGSWGGVDSTQILGALIILIVFGVFSAFNAYIGVFAGVFTAGVMVWIGWLSSTSQAAIVAAFALAILLAITYWKRRIN